MDKGPEAGGSKESRRGEEAVQFQSKEKVKVQLQEGSGHWLWDFIPR